MEKFSTLMEPIRKRIGRTFGRPDHISEVEDRHYTNKRSPYALRCELFVLLQQLEHSVRTSMLNLIESVQFVTANMFQESNSLILGYVG